METQAGENAQVDAPGQSPAHEAVGALEAGENLLATLAALERGHEHVRVSQFPIHFHVGHVDEREARVADLADQHFREFLADAIRDAL